MHIASEFRQDVGRLRVVLALTSLTLLAEVLGGVLTNSLALLSDAGHVLTDFGGVLFSAVAVSLASRPHTRRRSYGLHRLEIFAAFLNAIILLIVAAFILVEAARRLLSPAEVLVQPMLAVAVIGFFGNLTSLRLLRVRARRSLNIQGAYLEVMSDMLGSLAVIAAGLIILLTGWFPADPLVSVGVAFFIVPRAWQLLRQSADVLLEATPPGIDVEEVTRTLLEVPGVISIHELHVWSITSGLPMLSAHLIVAPSLDHNELIRTINQRLEHRYQIRHTTLQLEEERLVTRLSTARPDLQSDPSVGH